MNIKYLFLTIFFFGAIGIGSAQKYLSKKMDEVVTQYKGHTFSSEKTFFENIKDAPELSELAKILEKNPMHMESERVEMVTVFALSNKAFSQLEKKQKDSIIGNKELFKSVVKFYVVPGRIDKHGLQTEAEKHHGSFELSTLNGKNLLVVKKEDNLYLSDENGNLAPIVGTDFYHKHGFFHIVDGWVFPYVTHNKE